jgi:hypothetical protein
VLCTLMKTRLLRDREWVVCMLSAVEKYGFEESETSQPPSAPSRSLQPAALPRVICLQSNYKFSTII